MYSSIAIRFVATICIAVMASVAQAGAYEDYFFALSQDNADTVSSLIERGFDPNTVNPAGQHGLLLALRNKSKNVAKVLALSPITNIEVRSEQDESPLMLASLRGYLDICESLMDRDADINKPGWAPLHYAATGGHVDVIKALLNRHAYIDAQSPNGSTPLMMAAMYGSLDAVLFLLEAGADASLKNDLGLTAADFARQGNKPDSAEAIGAAERKATTGGTW